jgi:hypothetical protein
MLYLAALVSVSLLVARAAEPAPVAHASSKAASSGFQPLDAEPQAQGRLELQGLGEEPTPGRIAWERGLPVVQGFFGAGLLDEIELSGGSVGDTDGSDEDLSEFPVIGGGAQWKVAGERIDFGFEGLLSFGWRSDATAFAVGGGGAAIAVDVDMLLFELYGGPFVSTFLGDRLRAYVAGGPVMQWVDYDQVGPSGTTGSGDGFGTGVYARTGLELVTSPDMMVGVGARWVDATTDLGGSLGDLEMQGFQFMLTFSRGI